MKRRKPPVDALFFKPTMLFALLLMGSLPDVYLKADAEPASAKARNVTVFATLRRTPDGAATVVLDDGTVLVVTLAEVPKEWLPLVGKYVRLKSVLKDGRIVGWEQPTAARRNLSKLNGKKVMLEGVAENSKGGAILLIDDEPLYLRKLSSWPDALLGKQVVVKGTLKSIKLVPSPFRAPNGDISQGAEGDQWVLEDPTY